MSQNPPLASYFEALANLPTFTKCEDGSLLSKLDGHTYHLTATQIIQKPSQEDITRIQNYADAARTILSKLEVNKKVISTVKPTSDDSPAQALHNIIFADTLLLEKKLSELICKTKQDPVTTKFCFYPADDKRGLEMLVEEQTKLAESYQNPE
jgi:hypothetical protein